MKTPFMWAGSKDRDYDVIRAYIPNFKRYFEPFLGGGAVYFRLLSARGMFEAHCSDVNADLIATFETIRDDPEGLIAGLPPTKDRDTFQSLLDTRPDDKTEIASRFLYLNRNRFFGMGGWMNADRYAREAVISRIRHFSPLMQRTVFVNSCWNLPTMGTGDFAFCDPPYPDTNNAACYRIEDDALALNRTYFDHVFDSAADFFWVTKNIPAFEEYVRDRPGVQIEARDWAFRKPGQKVQNSEEIYIRREADWLISIPGG
jgi:site-specific DNA-adenine methylase